MAQQQDPEDDQQSENDSDELSSSMREFLYYFYKLNAIPLPKGCVRDMKISATTTHDVVTIEYKIPKRD